MIIIDEMINKRYFPGNISDYPLRIAQKILYSLKSLFKNIRFIQKITIKYCFWIHFSL